MYGQWFEFIPMVARQDGWRQQRISRIEPAFIGRASADGLESGNGVVPLHNPACIPRGHVWDRCGGIIMDVATCVAQTGGVDCAITVNESRKTPCRIV